MGEVNQVLQKGKKKKWGKEEWIILILVGAFLLIVFWPDSEVNDNNKTKAQVGKSERALELTSTNTMMYKEQMEKQLEEILRSIDGIDSVNAMITFQTSEEEVILRESQHTKETTIEEDSQGGIRKIEAESGEETVCYSDGAGEMAGPYVTYTISPKVEGVLVVVGGNKASLLRTQIVRAVQALFDVESHKVVVIKMKES